MSIFSTLSFIWRHPLNRHGKRTALSRFFRWQLSSRLLPYTTALPFVNETNLFARRGMTGATGNWYCGLHEYRDMGFLLHFLRAGDLFLDIGANVGSYTVLAAGAVGSKVIAVEPIPSTFKSLQKNIVLNHLSALTTAHCVGLSDKNGVLRFTSNLDTVNHVATESEKDEVIEVPVLSVDQLCDGQVPMLIKIDVEGHEKAVLMGAVKTLSAPGLVGVIMETNSSGSRYGESDDVLFEIMKAHGFSAYSYNPIDRRLMGSINSEGNTIFLRNIEFVTARLESAARYKLINGVL
jgi:FkbM family methyltransferase